MIVKTNLTRVDKKFGISARRERACGHDFITPGIEANIEVSAADDSGEHFHYPIESWVDFCMFNFCMDRVKGTNSKIRWKRVTSPGAY
jgi:hypothetical protein